MNKVTEFILDQLQHDMVSHGWLLQAIMQCTQNDSEWLVFLREILTFDVEIGDAIQATPGYVEFHAWCGPLEVRLARASQRITDLPLPDREFGYWLALRNNVDVFEE